MTTVKLLARSSGSGGSRQPAKPAKTVNSRMETRVFSRAEVEAWVLPPFQRPLRVNEKVRALAEEMKQNGGILSGVITLGRLPNDKANYLVDGQHRREAFVISELPEMLTDVRTCIFDDIGEMSDEFVRLQSSLVRMRPDDILRGLEATTRSLKIIRDRCPYVGYDQLRRGGAQGAIVGMSITLRLWSGSRPETPVANKGGVTAAQMAKEIDDLEVSNLCKFLDAAHASWGHDPSYARLWAGLNLGMCMWLYRRLVLDQDRSSNKRAMILTTEQFKKCLMAMSAEDDYTDWLGGRSLSDHHRNPCYRRIKSIFSKRLKEERIDNPRFPQPAWASS